MPKRNDILKCESCGMMVEVVHDCSCEPCQVMCCDEAMKQITANTVDAAKEKHVPVIEKVEGGYKVTIGSVPHPMEEKHYIEWIELMADGQALRQYLKPGDKPEAMFLTRAASVSAREFCNLHGLWKA